MKLGIKFLFPIAEHLDAKNLPLEGSEQMNHCACIRIQMNRQ